MTSLSRLSIEKLLIVLRFEDSDDGVIAACAGVAAAEEEEEVEEDEEGDGEGEKIEGEEDDDGKRERFNLEVMAMFDTIAAVLVEM